MTLEDIINSLKENEWTAFGGLPEECREFLRKTNFALVEVKKPDWYVKLNNNFIDTEIYRLKPSFKPPEILFTQSIGRAVRRTEAPKVVISLKNVKVDTQEHTYVYVVDMSEREGIHGTPILDITLSTQKNVGAE